MDLDKSGIVFLFRPFLLVSCYTHGKVPGSDLNVDSESVLFDIFTVRCQTHMFYCSQYCTLSQCRNVCLLVCF